MIHLKTHDEIVRMKRAGSIIGKVFEEISSKMEPGITTLELDSIAEKTIKEQKGIPAFKGYKGFPGNICTSINDVVVHGIPKNDSVASGDIVSIDVGVLYEGFFADAAYTFKVDKISKAAGDLVNATRESLFAGLEAARAGNRLSDISHTIQSYVESKGFSVVRSLVGHGIGKELHEEPEIPNFGPPGKGVVLKPGMALAIEPMVNQGSHEVNIEEDGWAVTARDRSLSAHFEHTVVITDDKPEIITKWQKKKQ